MDIKRDLILSKFAGASEILKDAYIVNPRDIKYLADLFYKLLNKPTNNVSKLLPIVEEQTIDKWANRFLDKINNIWLNRFLFIPAYVVILVT